MAEEGQHATYTFDFAIGQESKAVVDEGDLIIEGIAADWQLDRMDEAFEPGAFDAGMKAFMESNPILCFHHQYDKALGQVLEMSHTPDGIRVKARVDRPAKGSWAEDVYEKIKRGTIRAFSVGGKWHRRRGPDGKQRIYKADLAELSVTPLPVNQRTLFALAGKAFGEELAPEGGGAASAATDDDCGCGSEGKAEAETAGPTPEELTALSERLDKIGESFDRANELIEGKHPIEATAEQVKAAESAEGKATTDSASQRRAWAKAGIAMKDGSFPITHCGNDAYSNGAARRRAHQGSASESAILAHIAKREKALGCKTS